MFGFNSRPRFNQGSGGRMVAKWWLRHSHEAPACIRTEAHQSKPRLLVAVVANHFLRHFSAQMVF